jgi:hypothetical protein
VFDGLLALTEGEDAPIWIRCRSAVESYICQDIPARPLRRSRAAAHRVLQPTSIQTPLFPDVEARFRPELLRSAVRAATETLDRALGTVKQYVGTLEDPLTKATALLHRMSIHDAPEGFRSCGGQTVRRFTGSRVRGDPKAPKPVRAAPPPPNSRFGDVSCGARDVPFGPVREPVERYLRAAMEPSQ